MKKEYKSRDPELIRSYAKILNTKDPMKYWTSVYYPDELPPKIEPSERKIHHAYVVYIKTHKPISFDEYKKNVYKEYHKREEKPKKYMLQSASETKYFRRYKEIMEYLNLTYWQVVYMMVKGKSYSGYTLDYVEGANV